MEFLSKEKTIYTIIFIIDYGLAAFIYPALGIPRLDNWNNVNGQPLQQNPSEYSSSNYIHPNQIYSQWGYNGAAQPSQYFQPYYSHPSSSSSFQAPYASYRNSAFSYPTKQIDNFQKQQLASIADETESFNSERRKTSDFVENSNRGSEDGIQRILKTVAEKLPKIAETMSRFGNKDNNPITSQVGEEITNIDKQQIIPTKDSSILPYSLNKREYNINNNNELKEKNQNSLSSSPLFSSFSKLLSAFNAGNNNQNIISATTVSSSVIDKSVDLSPELIYQQKRQIYKGEQQLPDDKGYIPYLTPPPELPSPSQQNPLNSFLQQFGISNLMPNEKAEKNVQNKERQEKQQNKEENGDLIGNLMRGQLPQMPDWLSQFGFDSMLGQNMNNNEQQQSGNALAQIFGKKDFKNGGGGGALSSFFGSGLDDAPRK